MCSSSTEDEGRLRCEVLCKVRCDMRCRARCGAVRGVVQSAVPCKVAPNRNDFLVRATMDDMDQRLVIANHNKF